MDQSLWLSFLQVVSGFWQIVIGLGLGVLALAWWGFKSWLDVHLDTATAPMREHLQQCIDERERYASQTIAALSEAATAMSKHASATEKQADATDRLSVQVDQIAAQLLRVADHCDENHKDTRHTIEHEARR